VARGAKAAVTGKDRPQVTLQLATGRDVSGRAVAIADDGGLAMIALHVGGPVSAPTVAHVRIDHVVAVTHDLATDKPPMADEAAPGKLQLTRELAQKVAPVVANKVDKPVAVVANEPLGDDERRAVMAGIPLLATVLGKIADDAIGKDALRRVGEIRVGAATRGDVRLQAEILAIDLPRAADDAWDERTLRAAIEKVL
jgi:hypothetical protein